MLKKHEDKLNNETYSIGMSKNLPNNAANLAFIASPEITSENVSIICENIGIDVKEDYSENKHLHFAKDNSGYITTLPNQDILVTDEFSIKKYTDDIPEPLFYRATLKRKVKLDSFCGTNKIVPYQYGYNIKTESQIVSNLTDRSDVTPLIYTDIYEGTNNSIIITADDGTKIRSGFKIRMVQQEDNYYTVIIYNNFDQNKVYKVTYTDYTGAQVTETLESTLLFTRIPYEEFVEHKDDPAYWSSNVYAIKQEGRSYQVFAPTSISKITDELRKPFEFKYRVLANLKGNYSKNNPVEIKTGIIFLNTGYSEDMASLIVAFNQEVGRAFPEYVSFVNPHPPKTYYSQNEDHKLDPEYWAVDLTAPQDYINDYDIIFITGYGTHDMSAFNEKLKNYLSVGGKIVIDNLSNDELNALNVSFGDVDPILKYTIEPPVMTGSREFGQIDGYIDRHYSLTKDSIENIPYTDSGGKVSLRLTLINENEQRDWKDIIRYSSGSRSIAVKTYNGKGKIILSNCGFLKAFAIGNQPEAKKFTVNVVLTLAEDIWKVTPWIYDRVYHKSQLYKHEYTFQRYVADISPLDNSQIVAKKIISNKIQDFVSYYTGIYGMPGKYYTEVYERDPNGNFAEPNNIYMPASRQGDEPIDGNMPLYAFSINASNTSFDLRTAEGYDESTIYPYSAPVTFKVVITPITYRWETVTKVDDNGNVVQIVEQKQVTPGEQNMAKATFTITKDDGLVNLALLSTLLPPLPSGAEWADKSNIFFKVEVSGEEELDGHFINPYENRVNLYIYDKFTGKYIYTANSENIIPYTMLYQLREVQKYDGRTILRQMYNDIIIQASTGYYELVASKRAFAIVNNVSSGDIVKLPANLNTNESWFPKIKYLNFTKTSFNKDDYDRISKTIGFRYSKDEILEKAREYFGQNPQDDRVANIIARLNGNDIVDVEDMAVLAEAFDLIEEETAVYYYNIIEYFNQAWEEYPYMKVRDEYAQYVDNTTIKVQNTPLRVLYGQSTNEELKAITPTVFKAQNENWVAAEPVVIQMETEADDVWEDIQSGFAIDYANGLLIFDEAPPRRIRASYTYSNIKIIKKNYTNTSANMEELIKLQDRMYIIPNSINRRILRVPNPKLYIRHPDGETVMLTQKAYTIDYETGIITTSEVQTGALCMTYSYANIQALGIKDYDSKHGIIQLTSGIHFNDNIYVSYQYQEDYYEYKGYYDEDYIDPVTNVRGKFIHVDLNPTRGHECTYPVVEGDKVVYREVPTYKLLNKTIYLYMLPNTITRGNNITENQITIRHTFVPEELALMQLVHPEMIVLGSIKLINNYTPHNVITLDTRRRGGGLIESITNEQIEKRDELSLNLWDITPFDGRPYRPNGITIIKLPNTVLKEYGGKFTQDEVARIVEQHLALGVMTIIKYYEPKEE